MLVKPASLYPTDPSPDLYRETSGDESPLGTPRLPQPDLSPRHSLSGANKLAGEKDGGTTDARWLP